ncbi:hypothetical protein BHE74_00009632 [Ensete ventricosum]|nr:hypothetical protein BHE74_00009632 [Ensete ventricosum]
MGWSLPSVQSQPRQPRMERVSDLGRFSFSGVCISGWLFRALVGRVIVEEDLHKGLVGMRVPDVTPPIFKSVS